MSKKKDNNMSPQAGERQQRSAAYIARCKMEICLCGPTNPCLRVGQGQRTENMQLDTSCQLDQHHVV